MWWGWSPGKLCVAGVGGEEGQRSRPQPSRIYLAPLEDGRKASALECRAWVRAVRS